ncbi:MAG: hypothetical protein ACJ78R_08515, partial [Gemmatimonadaceae bacterium]
MQHILPFAATWRRDVGVGGKMLVHRTAFALGIAAVFLPACARSIHVKDYDEPPPPAAPAGPIVLEVENHNWADVIL